MDIFCGSYSRSSNRGRLSKKHLQAKDNLILLQAYYSSGIVD